MPYVHPIYGEIPDRYEPPISEEVARCAQRIAAYMLSRHDYGERWSVLYRHVRSAMGRPIVADRDRPTADDESVSEGIVRAINGELT